MKFKIGDRVIATKEFGGVEFLKGKIGKIIDVDCPSKYDYGVEFEEKPEMVLHSCGNKGKDGYCFWGFKDEIELIKSKFKVGDKVIGNSKASREYLITREGWIGTVVRVRKDGEIDVEGKGMFGSKAKFETLNEDCFDLYEEKPVKEEKEKGWRIEIVPDGEETTATLYKRGKAVKSATVKRYKGDEYSIADAADYAVKKLFEKKNKKQFTIGARVVGVGYQDGKNIDGCKGTIVDKHFDEDVWGVKFDERMCGGHTLGVGGHRCNDGHGWYCVESHLKLI